jgi:hypothetical protein
VDGLLENILKKGEEEERETKKRREEKMEEINGKNIEHLKQLKV